MIEPGHGTDLRLAGVHSKLDRADDRIREMGTALDEWAQLNPARLTYEHFPTTGVHEWRLSVDAEPPLDAGHLLVEAVYHLRAALDQLVNRVAEASGHPPGDKDRLQFPICGTRKSFRGTAPKALLGIPDSVRSVIESVQPFHEAHEPGERMRTLSRLSNVDKHRDVHPYAVLNSIPLAADAQVRAIDPVRSLRTEVFGQVGQAIRDLPMLSVIADPPHARVELTQIRIPKVAVVFGEGNATVMIADLRRIAEVVRTTVDRVTRGMSNDEQD